MAVSLHPAVKSGANWASYATLGLTLLNSITPDMLASLGKWEPLVNGAVVILGFVLGSVAQSKAAADPAPVVNVAPSPAVDPIAVAKAIPAVANALAQAAPELVTVGAPAEPAK